MDLLPPLETSSILLLLVSSFVGSLMTAMAGIGGGTFLIAIMADAMPPLALIPVHGAVQTGSNAGRTWLTRANINKNVIIPFAVGSIAAMFGAIYLLGWLDTQYLPLIVAVFVLWLVWLPIPNIGLNTSSAGLALGGLLTSFASVLVGASGPLVSAWLGKDQQDRFVYLANFSTCVLMQHTLKIVVFGVAGFVFQEWITLIAMMIFTGYLGTNLGLKLLGKTSQKTFKRLYKLVLTLLALKILVSHFVTLL